MKLIPICLVTGFLGSGKTTLLKRIVRSHGQEQLVYLVNEFSPQDIDGAIVSEENPNVVSIPGGSIFCRCLAGEFLSAFTEIPERLPDVEGIVIEASGMANPKVIADMLAEAGLDDRYELTHIVSIVDPGTFLKLRRTLPNIVAQIEAADTVIINKIDLRDDAIVAETADAIAEINPSAAVHRSSYSEVDLDLFTPAPRNRELHGEYALCRDPNYEPFTFWPSAEIDPEELRERITTAACDLYRAKGTVRAAGAAGPAGPAGGASAGSAATIYFDYSGEEFTARPVDASPAVVLIMRNDPSPAGRALVEWLETKR